MKKLMPKILVAVIIALACLTVFAACDTTPSKPTVITLFSTNDIHGNIEGDDENIIGIVKAAEIKASTPNSILIDAGDATQGASFASINSGADVIKMMNAAEYDVMAAGNHDFDYGAQVLLDNSRRQLS